MEPLQTLPHPTDMPSNKRLLPSSSQDGLQRGAQAKDKNNASVALNSNVSLPVSKRARVSRRGKWTRAEEDYAAKLIEIFKHGLVPGLSEGCTLKAFLASKLHCAPMRISKKFSGSSVGKMIFSAQTQNPSYSEEMLKRLRSELERSENMYLSEIEGEQREAAMAAAESAASFAVSAAANRHSFLNAAEDQQAVAGLYANIRIVATDRPNIQAGMNQGERRLARKI